MARTADKLIPPGLAYIAENIHKSDNILGLPRQAKSKWAEGIEFSKDRSTIFFAGCGYQYSAMLEPLVNVIGTADKMAVNPDLPVHLANLPKKLGMDVAGIFSKTVAGDKGGESAVLRDAVKVLKALGLDIGYLGEHEPCCGAPLYHIGVRNKFSAHAGKSHHAFKEAGVKRIISIVPSCTYALKTLYSRSGVEHDIEVLHFTEVAADKVKSLKLKYPDRVKVAYHDPCQLGRYMGLIEQPRTILKSIENIELVETAWTSGEWATCCGGGGGFEVVFPDISRKLAAGRVAELAETGANIIATQCPGCLMQLKSGLKDLKNDKIEVIDLATLMARSLPG